MNTAPVRILLVEDSPSDAELLRESLLEDGLGAFAITHVESWAEAAKELRCACFDVLLLDLRLPDSSGQETFVRARAEAPHLPIVVLTCVENEVVGLEAVRHGIQDYLTKSQADGRQTARAIRYAIERKRLETELQGARDELELRVQERTAALKKTVDRHKQAEKRLEGVAAMLKLFASKPSRKEYLRAVVRLLRDWCDCRCVGIRLANGDGQAPYAAQVGFGRSFIKGCDFSLKTCDCACVRLLSGKPRSEDAAFSSSHGSFFCNSTSRYAQQLGGDSKDSSRIACIKAGYESLAHAPIRCDDQVLGTIHLADLRPDKFPVEDITLVESVAPLIGEAIRRFEMEESLHESEARFRSLFERHAAVMLLIEPRTGALVDANPAAAAFYGYSQERLRTMKIEDLNLLPPGTLATHRRLALKEQRNYFIFPHRLASGESRTVEVHSSPVQVKGKALLFSIIHDITERKLLEKEVLGVSEKERQRVGQDLHDSLGGELAGTALMAKALAQRLAAKGLPESALAEEIVQHINESIAQTRSIARGLWPVEISVSGLGGTLAEFAAETQRRSGVACCCQVEKTARIEDPVQATHLFRIAQEAVNNAIRHGRPRQITIQLTEIDQQLALEVRDDGIGLPPRPDTNAGLGFRTMRYRAGVIGAELTVKPGEAGGTVVLCLLSLSNRGNAKNRL